jgi:pyruvate/2-oxoglutarate dehydrogenase complex dihydrolipoamide acyltransferase (E2) component
MTDELAGFGVPSWLPGRVQRAMAAEAAAERKEAREAEQQREARQEEAHDKALSLYRSQAEERGEVVSAVALATGQVAGRSIEDVFASAIAGADQTDARVKAQEKPDNVCLIDAPEPVIHGARRSGWPSSEYEADRMLRRAADLHTDLMAYRTRRDYGATVEAARAKSGRSEARRDRPTATLTSWSEISR